MKNEMQSAAQRVATLTLDARQLDVLMCSIEGMFSYDNQAARSVAGLAAEVQKSAVGWPIGNYDGFATDIVTIAPIYRKMLDAWQPLGLERNTGNEYADVFEFVDAVRAARAALDADGAEVSNA